MQMNLFQYPYLPVPDEENAKSPGEIWNKRWELAREAMDGNGYKAAEILLGRRIPMESQEGKWIVENLAFTLIGNGDFENLLKYFSSWGRVIFLGEKVIAKVPCPECGSFAIKKNPANYNAHWCCGCGVYRGLQYIIIPVFPFIRITFWGNDNIIQGGDVYFLNSLL